MSLIVWIVIILVVGIGILIVRKMRKKEDYLGDSLDERLGDKALNRIKTLGDCCKKIGRFFGGGA